MCLLGRNTKDYKVMNITEEEYRKAPRIKTKYRNVLIVGCPKCGHEYEEEDSAIGEQAANQCQKCMFIWVNEL